MKYAFIFVGSLALMAGCQSAGPGSRTGNTAGDSAAASSGASNPRAILHVEGMSCPLCATNIDKQLLGVRGVEDVLVNLGTGEVKVALSPTNPPDRQQLADAITRAGFTLSRIEMPNETKGGAP